MSEEKAKRIIVFDRKKMMKRIIEDHAAGELDDLYEYFHDLEGKFHGDKKRISQRYDLEAEKINSDPELKYQLDDYFSEEFHIIENVYLKVFRYSVVVGIHSVLAVCLDDLCRHIRSSNNLDLTAYSDRIRPRFRRESGHRSDGNPASIPIRLRPPFRSNPASVI